MATEIQGVKVLTVLEAAKRLDVTPQTIRDYINKKSLPAQKVGTVLLITEKDLASYEKGRRR